MVPFIVINSHVCENVHPLLTIRVYLQRQKGGQLAHILHVIQPEDTLHCPVNLALCQEQGGSDIPPMQYWLEYTPSSNICELFTSGNTLHPRTKKVNPPLP